MTRPLRAATLLLALSLSLALAHTLSLTAAIAGEPPFRFESVVPAGTGTSTWTVTLAVRGNPQKVKDKVVLRVDGAPVAAAFEPAGEGRLVARVSLPATAARLEAGTAGKAFEPAAALRIAAASPADAPFSDWSLYHVYLATFRNGDPSNDGAIAGWKDKAYAGGDLAGVLLSLDHVKKLGANAIWLSPLFAARTSHGYDVVNYWQVADQVGVPGKPAESLALFRKVVAEAHARGIRVILDIPLNHASRGYDAEHGDPLGLKPRAGGPRQPAEQLWESWGSGYQYWVFENEATRKFLVEAALHWVRDEGVDGLRLDYVRGVPHDFWAQLDAAVKKAKPGAFLVGECWADEQGPWGNIEEIATYDAAVQGVGPQFDALLDFPLQAALRDAFTGAPATTLEAVLQASAAAYRPGAAPAAFLDNHDLARFMDVVGDKDRLVAAVGFLSALSSPIVLFYGTETGLSGGPSKTGFTDGGRLPMPWTALDTALEGRVRQFLAARAEHSELTRGARLPVLADRTALVMAKRGDGETALVALNTGKEPRTFSIDAAAWFDRALPPRVIAGGGTVAVDGDTGKLAWTVPPWTTSIVAGLPAAAPSTPKTP